MITSEMLDSLPPAWLRRYEGIKMIDVRNLLDEYRNLEVKVSLLRMVLVPSILLLITAMVVYVGSKIIHQSQTVQAILIATAVGISCVFFLYRVAVRQMDRSHEKLRRWCSIARRLLESYKDIQTLINLVGGKENLNEDGIKSALIRLAKDVIDEEVGREKEEFYQDSVDLIRNFTDPPFDLEKAKSFAKRIARMHHQRMMDKYSRD